MRMFLKKNNEPYNAIEIFEDGYNPDLKYHVVYQDNNYSIYVDGYGNLEIESVFINDEETSNYTIEIIEQKLFIKFKSNIFSLIYGKAQISVTFTNRITYISPVLVVAINRRYDENMKSIHNMLDYIYATDINVLKSFDTHSFQEGTNRSNRAEMLNQEIGILHTIVQQLKVNLITFINNPITASEAIYELDNISKLRSMDSPSVNYILNNPYHLEKNNSSVGIKINQNFYTPKKTLINKVIDSKAVNENKIIVQFINTLIYYCIKQTEKILNEVNDKTSNIRASDYSLKNGYVLSTNIIEQYMLHSHKDYLKELKRLTELLNGLLIQYKRVLFDTNEILHSVPKASVSFMEIHHYRIIYQYIIKWFNIDKVRVPSNNEILKFNTADKIYEYYCLLSMLNAFTKLGFKVKIDSRSSVEYNVKHYDRNIIYKINNYQLRRNNIEIEIFYQPIIFAKDQTEHDIINLFRIDGNGHYTPDFLITVNIEGKMRYIVLDAKWRNFNSLNNTDELTKCIYKYKHSLVRKDNLERIDYMWILQGKDDNRSITTPTNNSANSNIYGSYLKYETGILKLTPQTGADGLDKLLEKILKY